MKINNVEKEVKEFQPVTLSVTFETQAELEAFWHRMNLAPDCYTEYPRKDELPECESVMMRHLWKWADSAMKEQKVGKYAE